MAYAAADVTDARTIAWRLAYWGALLAQFLLFLAVGLFAPSPVLLSYFALAGVSVVCLNVFAVGLASPLLGLSCRLALAATGLLVAPALVLWGLAGAPAPGPGVAPALAAVSLFALVGFALAFLAQTAGRRERA